MKVMNFYFTVVSILFLWSANAHAADDCRFRHFDGDYYTSSGDVLTVYTKKIYPAGRDCTDVWIYGSYSPRYLEVQIVVETFEGVANGCKTWGRETTCIRGNGEKLTLVGENQNAPHGGRKLLVELANGTLKYYRDNFVETRIYYRRR
jgi:hypothetical protein